MTEHVSIERMNEAVDGLLSASELAAVESHLVSCAACRNEQARVAEVVRAVGALPREARAPDGVWEVIAQRVGDERIDEPTEEVPVYRLPTAGRSSRRFTFSVPQLAAAGFAVALVSAGLMWVAIGGGGTEPAGMAEVRDAPGGAAARAVAFEGDPFSEIIDDYERVLADGRSVLTEETLVTIEESLTTINEAIADVEAALQADPGSDLLRRMLANHQRTKLGVLKRAAEAVQAQT